MLSGTQLIAKAAAYIDNHINNVHPGDILRYDFGIDEDIEIEELADEVGLSSYKLKALLDREIAVDAEIDLRLGRYFRVPDGFFLRMQNDYDLEEMHNRADDDLIQITPRAA